MDSIIYVITENHTSLTCNRFYIVIDTNIWGDTKFQVIDDLGNFYWVHERECKVITDKNILNLFQSRINCDRD